MKTLEWDALTLECNSVEDSRLTKWLIDNPAIMVADQRSEPTANPATTAATAGPASPPSFEQIPRRLHPEHAPTQTASTAGASSSGQWASRASFQVQGDTAMTPPRRCGCGTTHVPGNPILPEVWRGHDSHQGTVRGPARRSAAYEADAVHSTTATAAFARAASCRGTARAAYSICNESSR